MQRIKNIYREIIIHKFKNLIHIIYFVHLSAASGRIVTSIVLEHTLFPPRILTIPTNQENNLDAQPNFNDFIQFDQISFSPFIPETPSRLPTLPPPPPLLSPSPSPRPSSRHPPLLSSIPSKVLSEKKPLNNNDDECGRVNIQNSNINPLIAKGVKTSPGQWPWLVAIFVVKIQFEFHCTGTLVTNKHIVTGTTLNTAIIAMIFQSFFQWLIYLSQFLIISIFKDYRSYLENKY